MHKNDVEETLACDICLDPYSYDLAQAKTDSKKKNLTNEDKLIICDGCNSVSHQVCYGSTRYLDGFLYRRYCPETSEACGHGSGLDNCNHDDTEEIYSEGVDDGNRDEEELEDDEGGEVSDGDDGYQPNDEATGLNGSLPAKKMKKKSKGSGGAGSGAKKGNPLSRKRRRFRFLSETEDEDGDVLLAGDGGESEGVTRPDTLN